MRAGRRSAVVVGGGVTGLVAARALARESDVVLLEAAPLVGGKIRTTEFRGRPLDLGPDAFITRNGAARELCENLGLDAELIVPGASAAAVYARGGLRPLPDSLVFGVPTDLVALLRSGVVSVHGTLRALADRVAHRVVLPPNVAATSEAGDYDPTVEEVFRRRLGHEILDALIDPLIGGINASDIGRLSMVAAMPQISAALEEKSGILSALRPLRSASSTPRPSLFAGLERGLSSMTDTLASSVRALGAEVAVGEAVGCVERADGRTDRRWVVTTSKRRIDADIVVLAVPAFTAAEICAKSAPPLSADLAAIPYASVVTATLAWSARDVPTEVGRALRSIVGRRAEGAPESPTGALLPGSGVLVARGPGRLITALTFVSTKWPRSANPGEVVIRASLGRHGDDRSLALTDDELIANVRSEIADLLGVTAAPLETTVARWPDSFPQYVQGHRARINSIRRSVDGTGLYLAGAAYDGIGIPACVESGASAAAAALAS